MRARPMMPPRVVGVSSDTVDEDDVDYVLTWRLRNVEV
jgi:hypothetical protein